MNGKRDHVGRTGPCAFIVMALALAQNMSTGTVHAQEPPAADQPPSATSDRLFVDLEPLLFAQRGYGGSLGLMFGPERRWAASVVVFGVDLPDGFRDLFFEGAEDLDVRLNWGIGGDVRYRLTGDGSGLQVGVAVGAEQFRARAAGGLDDAGVNGFVTPHIGYLWHPRRGRFFIYPRLAGIFTIASERERELDGTQYELQSFVPNFNLRVGFRF